MNLLALNCGSSSMKAKCYKNGILLFTGKWNREDKEVVITTEKRQINEYADTVEDAVETLIKKTQNDLKIRIDGIGHRVTAGGLEFSETTIASEENMERFKNTLAFAPLHNPVQGKCIETCKKAYPGINNFMVFDTSYHKTMPEFAKRYAIPDRFYESGIKRFGAHGISHEYIMNRTAEILNKKPEKLSMISCHLGSGASITAIKNGKSVDTTMGFTPLEGLVMGTRSGTVDPTLVSEIAKLDNISNEQALNVLNRESGLLAIAGTADFRNIRKMKMCGSQKRKESAELAIEMFEHSVIKHIAAMIAVLNGELDAIVFTGGIGENDVELVIDIAKRLKWIGIVPTYKSKKGYNKFSTTKSKIQVLQIDTDEEMQIATEVERKLSE